MYASYYSSKRPSSLTSQLSYSTPSENKNLPKFDIRQSGQDVVDLKGYTQYWLYF